MLTIRCANCHGTLELSDVTVEELEAEFGRVPRRLKHVTCPMDVPDTLRFVTEVRIYGGDGAPRSLDPTEPADPETLLTGFRVEVEAEDFEQALDKLAVQLAPHWQQLQKNADLLTDAVLDAHAEDDEPVAVDG